MWIDALSLSSVGWSALAIALIVRPGVQNCGGCHAEKLLRWIFNAAQKQTVDRSIEKKTWHQPMKKPRKAGFQEDVILNRIRSWERYPASAAGWGAFAIAFVVGPSGQDCSDVHTRKTPEIDLQRTPFTLG
jgi:hypothetical protein